MLILGADVRRIPGATRTEYDTGVLLDLDLPAYLTNILQLRPANDRYSRGGGKFPGRKILDVGTPSCLSAIYAIA